MTDQRVLSRGNTCDIFALVNYDGTERATALAPINGFRLVGTALRTKENAAHLHTDLAKRGNVVLRSPEAPSARPADLFEIDPVDGFFEPIASYLQKSEDAT